MGKVKYWDGEDFTVLDSKDAQSVNGIKFRINVDILEYSNDGLTWIAQSDTDTITTINGKTGVITKADIVALGIPAQDTVYTHPAGTNPHGTTKADVGLGNVDNIQQASKTEFDTHNSDSTRHITSSERTAWNAKGSSNLALGETSATAYRGDKGKTAYDHSQTAHAPSNAQKNSDITKAEIEAKLTGAITTHTHDYASTSHTHNATDINAGTLAIARIPTGTTSTTVSLGNHTHSDYVPTSRTVAGKALTGNITLAKGDVGLGNVDNTSDANKPVSTAQQTALNAKMDSSKFQVVESLPASPVSGTFYFVKE